MGMSTHVVGFKPPDDKWKKMKEVHDACVKANVEIPEEVDDYFGGEYPDDAGVEMDLHTASCCRKYDKEGYNGFEIDVSKLPKDVKIVRFFNSY